MAERPIYLDYNATTPIDPKVVDVMLPYLYERFGNPSSSHAYGAEAKNAIEQVSTGYRRDAGLPPGRDHLHQRRLRIQQYGDQRRCDWPTANRGDISSLHLIEHPAVLEVCAYLSNKTVFGSHISRWTNLAG
jgi:cysteine desulfurase